jgi:hypothetical protein
VGFGLTGLNQNVWFELLGWELGSSFVFFLCFSFVSLILYNIHMPGMSLLYYTKNSSFLSSMRYNCQVYAYAMGLQSIYFFFLQIR